LIRDDITVRLAGESGEGVISGGDILTTGAARTGYWATTFRTYPAEIKGGPCMYQVRVGVDSVRSQGNAVDLLLCFNQEAFDLHHHELAADGHIVCDAESVKVSPEFESRSSEVPLGALAQEAGGSRRGKNMVAVGLVCGLLGIETQKIEEMILRRYAHKGDVGEANIRSLLVGAEHAREKLPAGPHRLAPATGQGAGRVLLSGNQAICLGALHAGLTYYAGYPITPASDILEWLAARLPRFGGVAIQTEDEIAALASVLGASYAGSKAMTATSGPGLSLMGELIGRDPGRDRGRPALRAVDRHAHQDRAVRSQPCPLRGPRRSPAGRDGADLRRGLLLRDRRGLQRGRAVPGAGDHAFRPVVVAPDGDRGEAGSLRARSRRASSPLG
jgi:2-oxoglutarate ferredoxin oxidoreductase subunit alpha